MKPSDEQLAAEFRQSGSLFDRRVPCVIVTLAIAFGPALAWADDEVQIAWRSSSTMFADQAFDYELSLTSKAAVQGRLMWALTVLHRTLGRGETVVDLAAGQPKKVALPLRIPTVKSGAPVSAELAVDFVSADMKKRRVVRKLWLFARDPFADRRQWLEGLQIQLYDPDGEISELLQDAKIPFRPIQSLANQKSNNSGITLIAEGVSLKSKPNLANHAFELAARGRRVLWFAPRDGAIDLGFYNEKKQPTKLSLDGSNIIKTLDHRLDGNHWTASGAQAVGLAFSANRNQPQLQVTPNAEDWIWLDAEFSEPDGRMILCGVRLADRWQELPTPRYLLAAILIHLDEKRSKPTEQPHP